MSQFEHVVCTGDCSLTVGLDSIVWLLLVLLEVVACTMLAPGFHLIEFLFLCLVCSFL
jgi:hypothetical protein